MFACIHVPDFPVEALVRTEPRLRQRAVAVLEGKPPLTRVVALNQKARTLGLELGMTKLQATVFTEKETSHRLTINDGVQQGGSSVMAGRNFQLAELRQRAPAQESSAHAALLDVAHAFTPRVEDTALDTVLLDLAGLDRLYGPATTMAHDLASRVAVLDVEANVAIADNPDAAMHAARGFAGTTIITPGTEAQRLGVLPVRVLLEKIGIFPPGNIDSQFCGKDVENRRDHLRDTLERWGIRDFRSLGLLPEHALVSRLGQLGTTLRHMARGESTRTLALCEATVHFEEAMELECAVETIESLSFVINRLLEQLCARLEARSLAVQELWVRLQLEKRIADEESITLQELGKGCRSHNGVLTSGYERNFRLPVSMRDPKVFLKLLQLDLAAHPPCAPVLKIWIKAEPAPPRSAQRGLFLPVNPEPERLEITLARIQAVVGDRRAGMARLLDSHRPEGSRVERFTIPASNFTKTANTTMSYTKQLLLATRVFRPALPLRVKCVDGSPDHLTAETTEPNRCLQGKVLWSAGPWRSSGEWWADSTAPEDTSRAQSGPWDYEEWDLAILDVHNSGPQNNSIVVCRIYRDLASGDWFAAATYD